MRLFADLREELRVDELRVRKRPLGKWLIEHAITESSQSSEDQEDQRQAAT